MKIQIIGGKVFCFQKFVYNAQQCFAFTPQADFPSYSLNFIEGESDEIKSRPPFKIFSTLKGKTVQKTYLLIQMQIGNERTFS